MSDPMPAVRSILGMPPEPVDPISELLEQAKHANSPDAATAYAQAATVLAIREQTEQLRIANKLEVAGIDAITVYADTPGVFRIRQYLTPDEWEGLDS